jgi:hypothetical protein
MLNIKVHRKTGNATSNQEIANAECANIAKAAAMLCDLVGMDNVILKGTSDANRTYYYMYPDTVMELYHKLLAMAEPVPSNGRKRG